MMNRIGAALVSVWVMAAVLVMSGCDRPSTASPDTPSPESTTSPAKGQAGSVPLTAAQVFRRGHLKSYASRNGLESLTVWEVCAARCRHYWVLSGAAPEAIAGDAMAGGIPAVTASRRGYVLKAFGRPGFVVRPDGTTLPLHRETMSLQIDADTVILQSHRGELTAVDAAHGTTWELPARPGHVSIYKTAVSGGGTVWAIANPAQGADLRLIRLRGGKWRSISMSGLYPADTIQQDIVATGHTPTRIAIAATYGQAMTPPAMLLVSTDAGQNWHRLVDDGRPFSLAYSMAIAGDALYLADLRGRVWRTVDPHWTRLERVPGSHGVIGLQPAGDRVIGWRWRFNELVSIAQTGRVRVIRFKQRTANE